MTALGYLGLDFFLDGDSAPYFSNFNKPNGER